MSEEITQLKSVIEKLGNENAEFTKTMADKVKQLEEKGFLLGETQEKLDKQSEVIGNLEDDIASLKQRSDSSAEAKTEQEIEQKQLFNQFVRKGFKGMDAESQAKVIALNEKYGEKAMFTSSAADGGFTVRPQMATSITENVKELSPIRQIADVMTVGSNEFIGLYDESNVGSGWVGETESRPETATGTLSQYSIPVNTLYAKPAIFVETLEDSEIDLEAYLQNKVATEFAIEEGTAFVVGNGVKKPKGFNSYTAGSGFDLLEDVTTDATGTIAYADLIETTTALLDPYKNNATWVMSKETRSTIRQIADLDGRPIWEPNVQAGMPPTLLGYRVVTAVDMPAIAANALSVAFGDFRKGYKIVQRQGIRVVRNPYLEEGKILYYTTTRLGGGVQDFQAIKRLKVKA